MNGLDIIILIAFFGSTLIGALRGFTKELLSLFSWGGAVGLSYVFLPVAQEFMHQYVANATMAGGAGFFCVFIISLVILSIVANIIAGYIHESSFKGIDHSLGFGFGIFRGVVFLSAIELGISTFWPRQTQSETIQTARFIPMVRKGADTLLQVLPTSARSRILEQATKVENQINSKVREQLKAGIPGLPRGAHASVSEGLFGEGGSPGTSAGNGGPLPFNPSSLPGQPLLQAPSAPLPMQGSPQVMAPSPMVVIRPPQPGQAPQLAPASDLPPATGGAAGAIQPFSPPVGLAQSATPQDTQSTVDKLARLNPHSSPQEERGYTRGQRDDMNRLFQAADGG
jgi:membrane protein required for colicin V production